MIQFEFDLHISKQKDLNEEKYFIYQNKTAKSVENVAFLIFRYKNVYI